ncbi:MAG: hypothetical protein P4M09_17140 [Devosia sp.]|nr:hypothetical protein [Devosia sp.]
MSGGLVFLAWIDRTDLRAQPDARFVFGDNSIRQGYGGQAAAMRDEPNAIGIATKWFPGGGLDQYFADDDPGVFKLVDDDIDLVVAALLEGRTVYVPRDGLGTGLSQLPIRAPQLHQHIIARFRALVPAGDEFPWGEK